MTTMDLEALPKCSKCGRTMVQREVRTQTREQQFCGAWFDHPATSLGECGDRSSVLWTSPALRQQLADQVA